MIQTKILSPGVRMHCHRDQRFKQGCLSFQLVRRMCASEAAMNALIPSVLLRGTVPHPDLRSITEHLDMLYGASVSPLVRRIGDYQTVGMYCGFMDDRFALPGDHVLAGMADFLRELLLAHCTEGDGFRADFVESEKKNLISTIESQLNDKRIYAMSQLLKTMCREDSFGLPRLGEPEDVEKIDPVTLLSYYRKILAQSPIEIFYVGSQSPETVEEMLLPLLRAIDRDPKELPAQSPFRDCEGEDVEETMEVTQGKLCLGFTTPITNCTEQFAAMQVMNVCFGGGMTSKLFMNVREKMSLCYSIGSGYYSTKGIVTVSAGIDFDKEEQTRSEILRQLSLLQAGELSEQELNAGKEGVISGLRAVHDSPGSIENYYATATLSGLGMTPEEYRHAVEAVTADQVVAAANKLQLHSTYFLKGAE